MNLDTRFLRECKARRLHEIYGQYVKRDISAPGCLRVLEGPVGIVPLGQVIGAYRNPQPDLIIDDDDMVCRIVPPSELPPDARRIEGNVVFYGNLHLGWGHLLMNTLSRCWHRPADADAYVFAFSEAPEVEVRGNYRRALQGLGLTDKMQIVHGPTLFTGRVTVPELSMYLDAWWSDAYGQVIDDMLRGLGVEPELPVDPGLKVFMTRTSMKGARSREIGLEWFDAMFAANGFKVVSPEHYDVADLARLLKRASLVASISGTTAHNMLLGRRDATLWILERLAINNYYQAVVSFTKNNDVACVDANLTPGTVVQHAGPMVYYPAPEFEAFARDKGLQLPPAPDARRLAKRFWRSHRRFYGRGFMPYDCWALPEAETVAEALMATNDLLGLRWPRPKGAIEKALRRVARKVRSRYRAYKRKRRQ